MFSASSLHTSSGFIVDTVSPYVLEVNHLPWDNDWVIFTWTQKTWKDLYFRFSKPCAVLYALVPSTSATRPHLCPVPVSFHPTQGN